jgi:hypothetical protein
MEADLRPHAPEKGLPWQLLSQTDHLCLYLPLSPFSVLLRKVRELWNSTLWQTISRRYDLQAFA